MSDADNTDINKDQDRVLGLGGMDSMDVRAGYWSKTWKIPDTLYTITGYSRAAYRTGFYIKELDLMLDAGPQNFNKPGHIMITHVHDDHLAELGLTLLENLEPPMIYAPASAEQRVANFSHGGSYNFMGLELGTMQLTLKNNPFQIRVIDCDHGIDTVSFCFSLLKKKIKEEYKGLKGTEIRDLKSSGVEIINIVPKREFAFICDTSIKVFKMHPEVLEYPVIIIECTFLQDEELDNAVETKHIHWKQLEPIVASHPGTTFMLIHFSLRCGSDRAIREFFDKVPYPNVHCWA